MLIPKLIGKREKTEKKSQQLEFGVEKTLYLTKSLTPKKKQRDRRTITTHSFNLRNTNATYNCN